MGLKIAMVTSYGVRCGIASYSENLANALAKEGVDVYVVRVPRFGQKTKEILLDVADRIPKDKVNLCHIQHEYGIWQGFEPDFYGYLQTLGLPIVTTMHAVGNFQVDGGVCSASKKVIVHNEFCARKLGLPSTIIPHGCSPMKCPPIDECKKSFGIDPRVKVVGYVGFISNYKGLETMIAAMSKVANAGVLIGGGWHTTGPETQYIVQLKQRSAELLGDRCKWLGYVPDETLSRVYGSMDIVIYPSIYATESGALLTAISHGKAVIASNVPPFREKEKQGALMTFKGADDLTRKIKKLLKNDELRRELEEGARAYAESVSYYPNIAQKHIELYESVLADKPN
jgi:glycosyltransferase involved in cell wall biosynthesis